MYIGHYGVAFAFKGLWRSISLGLLFIAIQFVDILWAIFVLVGREVVNIVPGITAASPLDFVRFPYSHSLVASFVWAGAAYALFRFAPSEQQSERGKVALVMGVAVLSHFFLDVIVHRPDLPLLDGGSPKIGLGLWNNALAAYAVEGAILLAGLALYLRSTAGATGVGRYGTVAFTAGLLVLNAFSIFGPPLPTPQFLAAFALITYLAFAGVAYWLDRKTKIPTPSPS